MIHLVGERELESFSARFALLLRRGDTIALSGDLGAGKTSFARGVLRGLGFTGDVPSPSFLLVQIYDPPLLRLPVWHVDLYRLKSKDEVQALALEEGSNALMIIEWPERLGDALDPNALRLRIDGAGEAERRLTAEVPASWKDRWPSN